ncbi:hypothetical protein EP18_14080 [Lysinibacillus sphaericus]|nr:hypothetical protein [Lysinibacillus sphaericus]KEK10219.1 hypothetical protein EP18_18770 [Lysinibacillus sphaericus]KEK11098.1 hypothetical protein EP18_14080 [Lysinibacillus sphaericus]
MIFLKPDYYEVYLANWKKDDFQDEILIHSINSDFKIQTHAPIDVFFPSRNRGIICGCHKNGDCVSKSYFSIRTKKQEYAGWPPILTTSDFEKVIQSFIDSELAKSKLYIDEPKQFSFYRDYASVKDDE